MGYFAIITDSNSDLPKEYIQEHQIGIISHYYDLDGITYGEDNQLSAEDFYAKMREGYMPTTMASNPAVIHDTFLSYAEQELDVLHISFSSALSGGYNNVFVGASEICEEYPKRKILVIDSLNVSLGQGMMIMKAVEMRKEGATIEATAAWLEEHKLHYQVQFTVDDLHHLQRGGRISKITAVVGSVLQMKPILSVNAAGELVNIGSVRGRKHSLSTLLSNMKAAMEEGVDGCNTICIVHGDAPEDAAYLKNAVQTAYPDSHIVMNTISPSIGAHSGPGAVGILFMGKSR